MPVTEHAHEETTSAGNRKAAIAAATAAAAGGAATFAVRRALSRNGSEGTGNRRTRSHGSRRPGASSILSSAAAGSWDAVADMLVPWGEDAAEAVGKYLAQRGPAVIRERIVPKFIAAFSASR